MPDLFGQQWGLTLLGPALITWGVGLAPALLIRFILVRRPIGDGWALVVAALFLGLHYALADAFGGERPTYETLVLIAIVSYLLLTLGKRDRAPVIEQTRTAPPKTVASKAAAATQDAVEKRAVEKKTETAARNPAPTAPAVPAAKPKPAKLEAPKPKESTPSAVEEEAKLRRYDTAWRELESGKTHRGVWGRAFEKVGGDEQKARVQYLKDRTEYLERVEQRQEEQRSAQKIREREIQKQKERERFEQLAMLNKETLLQREEQEYRDLLTKVASEQSELVNMLRNGINEPDKWNEFKLTTAAQLGSDENVLALLAAGANPLLKDNFGHTARDYARQQGRTEIVQYLEIAERLCKQESLSPEAPAPASEPEVKSGP